MHRRDALLTARTGSGLVRTVADTSLPVASVGLDGLVLDANRALCRLVGRRRGALVGSPLHALSAYPTDRQRGQRALAAARSGVPCGSFTQRWYDASDTPTLRLRLVWTLVRDAYGAPESLLVVGVPESSRPRGHASDLSVVTDASGRVVEVSPGVDQHCGRPSDRVTGSAGADLLHPDDRSHATAVLARVARTGSSETLTLRARGAEDAWRWLEATVTRLPGTARGVLWSLRDVDDRVRAETALRASEARYRAIADNADEGVCVFGPDGRTVHVNNRLREILGLGPAPLDDWFLGELLDPDERLEPAAPAPGEQRAHRFEVDYRHPDGSRRTLRVSAAHLDECGGTAEGSLAMVSDVTDARRLEGELQQAALRDSLTGLPNRALLFDRLQGALVRAADTTVALLVDLDGFKAANDVWGHVVGDELLVHVAARLRAAARPADTVARFAGDQFLVVCEGVDSPGATRLAEELLAALHLPYRVSRGEVRLTASIGVASSPADSAEELLHRADLARGAAKAAGGGCARAFDPVLAGDAEARQRLGSDLRRALQADELTLHHQPVVDLRTGAVVGIEALARWTHPVHGVVAPDRFVPVAEQVGLAPELDRWALRRALADAHELRASGALSPDSYVAVNVSAHSLGDPTLDAWIADTVAEAGFSPGHLLIEVTESAVMADTSTAVGVLRRLRERGFGIAVDDFGTGHSSLAYLRNLPLTVLKIDRSFVAEIATDPSALAIAGSIVDLARAVGLTVVAEGVETPEHAELLQRLGCPAAQGWLWSPAVSTAEAGATAALTRTYAVAAGSPAGCSS